MSPARTTHKPTQPSIPPCHSWPPRLLRQGTPQRNLARILALPAEPPSDTRSPCSSALLTLAQLPDFGCRTGTALAFFGGQTRLHEFFCADLLSCHCSSAVPRVYQPEPRRLSSLPGFHCPCLGRAARPQPPRFDSDRRTPAQLGWRLTEILAPLLETIPNRPTPCGPSPPGRRQDRAFSCCDTPPPFPSRRHPTGSTCS